MFFRNGLASSAVDSCEPRMNSDAVSSNMEQSVTIKDCFQYTYGFHQKGEKEIWNLEFINIL